MHAAMQRTEEKDRKAFIGVASVSPKREHCNSEAKGKRAKKLSHHGKK
jgi:hypothetical protein